MTDRVVILRPDAPREIIERTTAPSVDEVQKWVGDGTNAYVQLLPGDTRYDGERAQLYVDEDGGLKTALKPNLAATQLVLSQQTDVLVRPEGILGTMVILQGKARWS